MSSKSQPRIDASPADAPELPALIGKYRVLSKLGEGATSEVFLCHDDFLDLDVAINRVRPIAMADAQEGRYFERFFAAEAALVGRLKHPNVVQIFDAVPDPVEPYLVMEYVSGNTLRPYCRADQLLPLELIVELGFKCAMALGYVYRQGLIHRDVKPANLLAVMDGDELVDVKITDFGSAFNFASDLTQVYRVGSLAYMSPEQLEGRKLSPASDVYSLGVVLYEMLVGRAPHAGLSPLAIAARIAWVRAATDVEVDAACQAIRPISANWATTSSAPSDCAREAAACAAGSAGGGAEAECAECAADCRMQP